MLETLKARKEALEARGESGFTLMEMLIVIAIIAILIAIAIPIFTTQLNNAKHAADEANARSIYAMVTADYLDNNTVDNAPTGMFTTAGPNNAITVNGQEFAFSDICASFAYDAGSTGVAPTITVKWTDSNAYPDVTFGGSNS